jgi:hypothetical protein
MSGGQCSSSLDHQRRAENTIPTLQWYGNVSGSIQKLPNELLSDTFRYYVDLGDSPWRLTFVCKRWRDVALTTPSLWTSITITIGRRSGDIRWDYFGTTKYSHGSSSLCHNIEEMEDAMCRAGVLPLQVHIVSYEDFLHPISPLMSELFGSPSVDQIEELYIDICEPDDTNPNPIFHPLSDLKVLQVINIPADWADLLFKAIYTSSATSLLFLGVDPSTTYSLLEENISMFTRLERLQRCPWYWPNQITQSITIPQLIELEISCQYQYLDRLQLPRLQTLEICTVPLTRSPSDNDKDCRPNFPHLVELRATTPHTKWLEYLIIPKLQILSIVGVVYTDARYPQMHLLPPNLFPTVKHFIFMTSKDHPRDGDGDARDSFFISALQSVPNAISVRISAGSSSKPDPKLRLQLLDQLGSMEAEEILCPKLQDLELTSQTQRDGALADYEVYLLQRIADMRSDMGRGLTRFVVRWNQKGETITRRYA